MDKKEFSRIRRHLGKTQKELAQLLGVSSKAIESFEQGWRNIPVHTERQVLFLMALRSSRSEKLRPCWVIKGCPKKTRNKCPAWEFQAGHLCWFSNGTICEGEARKTWGEKMRICRECAAFVRVLPQAERDDFQHLPKSEPL